MTKTNSKTTKKPAATPAPKAPEFVTHAQLIAKYGAGAVQLLTGDDAADWAESFDLPKGWNTSDVKGLLLVSSDEDVLDAAISNAMNPLLPNQPFMRLAESFDL